MLDSDHVDVAGLHSLDEESRFSFRRQKDGNEEVQKGELDCVLCVVCCVFVGFGPNPNPAIRCNQVQIRCK